MKKEGKSHFSRRGKSERAAYMKNEAIFTLAAGAFLVVLVLLVKTGIYDWLQSLFN
jgi:hypothetical protein